MSLRLILVAPLLLAACVPAVPAATATSTPGEVTVAENAAFVAPDGSDTLNVGPGTTVTFENRDGFAHTATHGSAGSPAADAAFDISLPAGGSGSFTFEQPGTYPVTCTIHPEMHLTIVVE